MINSINRRGYTLIELLISSGIVTILFASAIGGFVLLYNVINYSLEEYGLQRSANVAMNRIIRNVGEGGALHGLRSAKSFTIPSPSEIDYTGTDGVVRTYRLNQRSIIYDNPSRWPYHITIFTAPANSVVTLRFWQPPEYLDNETVGIYIGITRPIAGRTVSGSASTYVNLRNTPK